MKKAGVILICLLTWVAIADRRGQLMQQKAATSSACADCPPSVIQPGIWVDVKEKTNLVNFAIVTNMTNFGTLGGYFKDPNAPATNKIYMTAGGGCITGKSDFQDGFWWVPDSGTNTQQYFQTNMGSIAMRAFYSENLAFGDRALPVKTGLSPPVDYVSPHNQSGMWFYDWGAGVTARLSVNLPNGNTNAWINTIFIKSNGLMQIWVQGTNYAQVVTNTAVISATNMDAGPLVLMGQMLDTNYFVKRIVMWSYPLSPTEITNVNSWMTTLP